MEAKEQCQIQPSSAVSTYAVEAQRVYEASGMSQSAAYEQHAARSLERPSKTKDMLQ